MHGHSVTVSRVGQHHPHYLANDMGAMFTSLSYSKLSFMITKYSKSYFISKTFKIDGWSKGCSVTNNEWFFSFSFKSIVLDCFTTSTSQKMLLAVTSPNTTHSRRLLRQTHLIGNVSTNVFDAASIYIAVRYVTGPLECDSSYIIKLSAYNSAGESGASQSLFKTVCTTQVRSSLWSDSSTKTLFSG